MSELGIRHTVVSGIQTGRGFRKMHLRARDMLPPRYYLPLAGRIRRLTSSEYGLMEKMPKSPLLQSVSWVTLLECWESGQSVTLINPDLILLARSVARGPAAFQRLPTRAHAPVRKSLLGS